MSDTQGTWKGSAPFGTGWNADVVEAVGSDLAINNGTIDVTAITADTLWGNPQTIAAKPTPVAIGPGLTLPATGTLAAQWQTGTAVAVVGSDLNVNSGTIDLAPITAASLYGNPGTAAAKPSAITIGSGLTLSAVGTLSNTGILSLVAGTNVTISGGNTINATAGGSGISSLVIGSGLAPAGTISSGGTTVSLGTIAASSLMGNPGTAGAVPGAIAVGTNLTLSAAGTLSASAGGTGTVTQVVAGAGLAGGTITTAGTISAQWQGGTVTAIGPEFVEPSGTLHYDQMATYISASATIDTTYFGKNLVDNSTGASDIVLTMPTLAAGTHLTFNVQNNSAHHYMRLRPATGVFINGVSASDYLLPNFTGGSVAIDSTGTAYTTGAALSFWNASAGYVTALNGLNITNNGTFSTNGTLTPVVDGTSIVLSGGTLIATATSYKHSEIYSTGAGTGSTAFATRGNQVAFTQAQTIASLNFMYESLANGGSYVAQISALDATGTVVASVLSTSGTFIASSTLGGNIVFSFPAPVICNTGTTFLLSTSRLDGGATGVLPTAFVSSTAAQFLRGSAPISFQLNLAGTIVAAGNTLAAVSTTKILQGMDSLP